MVSTLQLERVWCQYYSPLLVIWKTVDAGEIRLLLLRTGSKTPNGLAGQQSTQGTKAEARLHIAIRDLTWHRS